MELLRLVLAKWRALVRRNVVAEEIRDEMQFHVEMRAEALAARGLSAQDAAQAARKRFGNLALMQDRGYDVRGAGLLESVVQDLRFSGRLFRHQKGFAIVAVVTLALAIGASTAIFSVVDAALIRPLPFRDLDRIVMPRVVDGSPASGTPSFNDLEAWRRLDGVFSVLTRAEDGVRTGIVDSGRPERLMLGEVGPGYFEIFGGPPFLGRDFSVDDTLERTASVAILSHDFWLSRFNADPSALGRTIRVDRDTLTIVGILPRGFKPNYFGDPVVWRPLLRPNAVMQPMRSIGIGVFAKLRPGVDLARASRETTELARRIAAADGQPTNFTVEFLSLYDEAISWSRGTLRILVGSVIAILLIACINVAGLLLARASARESELAIRASIGAGRGRLVRQLLTESLVLAAVAGIVGVGLAWLILDLLVAVLPLRLPANVPPEINVQVLAFTAGLSVTTALAFGLLPALRLSHVQLRSRLSRAGRHTGPALSRRSGQLLIAGEVALAIVLLAGAGLLVRSLTKALSIDVGFDPGAIVTIEAFPVDERAAVRHQYFARLAEAARAVPGVSDAGVVDILPFGEGGHYTAAEADGVSVNSSFKSATAGYLEALGLTAMQGRLFNPTDRSGTAVLSESAARRLFPQGSAVGRQFISWKVQYTVVGVVRDVLSNIDYTEGFARDPRPDIYLALDEPFFADRRARTPKLVVRTGLSVAGLADSLRRTAQGIGPAVIVERIRSGRDWFGDVVQDPRHRTLLIGSLGGLALLLTLVGIFGVTAYSVARRTQEIGVRMAFGARPGQIVGRMIGDAAWPMAIGVTAGLAGAYWATRLIESFLFDTTPHDVPTFMVVALFMAVTAIVAAWIPARRAAQVDPVQALRAE